MKEIVIILLLFIALTGTNAEEVDYDFTSNDVDTILIHFQSSSPYGGESPVILICDLFNSNENIPSYSVKVIETHHGASDPFSAVPSLEALRKEKGTKIKMKKVHLFAFDGILKALRSEDWPFVSDGLLGPIGDVKFQFILEGKVAKEEEFHFTGNPHALTLLVEEMKGSIKSELSTSFARPSLTP